MHLLLLGTEGCHLCEEAQEIVSDCLTDAPAGITVEPVDIADRQEWQPDYSLKIPVLLEPESRRELGWPFDRDQVVLFLRQAP